jgi:ABC-type oligopeptide transport system substrate-binding subunit
MSETEGITQRIDETGEESFAMINSQVPPFNDIRAREALTLATDREGYQVLINEDLSHPGQWPVRCR